MNKFLKKIILSVFGILLAANVYVFMNGVHLSNNVAYYESQVTKLRKENILLEKQVYKFDSISYAASIAAELQYTPAKNMIYVTKPGFALNH